MFSVQKDWRSKNIMYDPRQFTMESYYTDAHQKSEMKHAFQDEILNNLHLLSDPLKKNLADSMITPEERPKKKTMLNVSLETETPKLDSNTNRTDLPSNMASHMPFSGITNFFSSVVSVISGAMGHWRPKAPAQYYDCFDDLSQQGAPQTWQSSNGEVQNKSARDAHSNSKSDMNIDCKAAAAHCEEKINKVRLLLATKPVETPKFRPRRPKKQFVEANLVEEKFEDAFAPEDFASHSISNNTYIEYCSPFQIHHEELFETASPKIKTESTHLENTEIIKTLSHEATKSIDLENNDNTIDLTMNANSELETKVEEIHPVGLELKHESLTPEKSTKEELVLSCESKLSQLKVLLQEKRNNNKKTVISSDSVQETEVKSNEKHHRPSRRPVHCKTKDKHYKNPNRTTDKRRKSRMKRSIQDDLVFAHELNSEVSSVENSPSVRCLDRLYNKHKNNSAMNPSNTPEEYFDEVSGRFRSTSTTESEDSFQIVFNDSPKESRVRQISECDSEDSFIVFEESPENCYTSNDVFGDSDESDGAYTESESELSDTEDVEAPKLSHSLSRTFSDLTNGGLYVDKPADEVDCALRSVCAGIPLQNVVDVEKTESKVESTGLLLNEYKKLLKKSGPPKKVQFSSEPPKVHVMRVWAFAARQARAGHWERCVIDRERFKRRIADVDLAVSWVLKPQHRSRVMFQRFMPWWNALKRKELAEKKAREEEEKMKAERLQENMDKGNLQEQNLANGNIGSVDNNNCDIIDSNVNVDNVKSNDVNNKKQNSNDTNGNNSLHKQVEMNIYKKNDLANEKLDIIKINGVNKDLNKTVLNSAVNMTIVPANEKLIDSRNQLEKENLSNT